MLPSRTLLYDQSRRNNHYRLPKRGRDRSHDFRFEIRDIQPFDAGDIAPHSAGDAAISFASEAPFGPMLAGAEPLGSGHSPTGTLAQVGDVRHMMLAVPRIQRQILLQGYTPQLGVIQCPGKIFASASAAEEPNAGAEFRARLRRGRWEPTARRRVPPMNAHRRV